jgi:hypothetical protein
MIYDEFKVKQDSTVFNYYTKIGYEDYLDDNGNPRLQTESNRVFAKSIKDKLSKNFTNSQSGYSYYVKTDPNKNLFDPVERHSIDKNSNTAKSFINKICKTELKYTEVSESVFTKYLNFLKTENLQWLNQAQREIR